MSGAADQATAPELSVVVVNHNGADCLSRTLAALARHTSVRAECVIVDSGSTDGSWLGVEDCWDVARVVRFDENIGFCAGCNRGAETATAPLVAFVNFDGEVERGWDLPLRRALSDPGISVAGGMLVDPSGEVVEALGLAIAPNFATFGLMEGVPRRNVRQERVAAAAVSGALMMVRRQEFLELGGFYELLWMFGEEADFCLRVPGRVVADPRSVIRHEFGHAAGPRRSHTRVYWPSRNRLINAARHLGAARFAMSVATSAAFDVALLASRRDSVTFSAVLGGWHDGLRLVPREWTSRRAEARKPMQMVSLRAALAQQRTLNSLRRGVGNTGA